MKGKGANTLVGKLAVHVGETAWVPLSAIEEDTFDFDV